jgi:hypothetical protein
MCVLQEQSRLRITTKSSASPFSAHRPRVVWRSKSPPRVTGLRALRANITRSQATAAKTGRRVWPESIKRARPRALWTDVARLALPEHSARGRTNSLVRPTPPVNRAPMSRRSRALRRIGLVRTAPRGPSPAARTSHRVWQRQAAPPVQFRLPPQQARHLPPANHAILASSVREARTRASPAIWTIGIMITIQAPPVSRRPSVVTVGS